MKTNPKPLKLIQTTKTENIGGTKTGDYVQSEDVITRFVVKDDEEDLMSPKPFKNVLKDNERNIKNNLSHSTNDTSTTGLSALYTKRKQKQFAVTTTKRALPQHKMAPSSACVDGSLFKTVASAWAQVGCSDTLSKDGSKASVISSSCAPLPFKAFVDQRP